jgi:signal peptidase II
LNAQTPSVSVAGLVRRLLPWLGFASLVMGLDRWSKLAVTSALAPGDSVVFTPFFSLVLWFNSGAAFSFLAGEGGWQRVLFSGVAVAATLVIVWLLARHGRDPLFNSGLALILGGALGNLWDRIESGRVVDFLLFHAGEHYFPAFNLADSAITVGAALIILDGLLGGPAGKRALEQGKIL